MIPPQTLLHLRRRQPQRLPQHTRHIMIQLPRLTKQAPRHLIHALIHPPRYKIPAHRLDQQLPRRQQAHRLTIEIDLIGLYSIEILSQLPQKENASHEVEHEEWQNEQDEQTEETPQTITKTGAWLVQVRYTKKPMSPSSIRKFLQQVQAVSEASDYASVTSWFVCKAGFTKKARQLLKESGVLFSNREQFNKLANQFGFFGLPA